MVSEVVRWTLPAEREIGLDDQGMDDDQGVALSGRHCSHAEFSVLAWARAIVDVRPRLVPLQGAQKPCPEKFA